MTLATTQYSAQECVDGFVQAASDADAWFKEYLMTEGASPTAFYKSVEAACVKKGIPCPVKLKTLQNKAGQWRSLRLVPPAVGQGRNSHPQKKGPESGASCGKTTNDEKSLKDSHNSHQFTNVQERSQSSRSCSDDHSRTQGCLLTTTNKSHAITPDVVQSEKQCISVMSEDDTEACSDWQRASQLLTDLEGFTHKYFADHHRIGEEQWEDFAIRCRKLAYFADMRYANLRETNEQQASEVVRSLFPE